MEKLLTLEKFREKLSRELFAFLNEKRKQAEKIDRKCILLIDEIIRLNRAGGKRLRPYICYLGNCLDQRWRLQGEEFSTSKVKAAKPSPALRLSSSPALSACLAVELLESMALIHDDIMDEAQLRRGQPSTYAKYGRDTAILVGDLCFPLMDECMLRAGHEAQKLFQKLKFEIVCGQFLDTLGSKIYNLKSISEEEILKIYKYKTAMYTVTRPLQIGYLQNYQFSIFNFQREQREHPWGDVPGSPGAKMKMSLLEEYGENLGIAFQIKDDLIDLFGIKTGKAIGGDIGEGKLTYMVVKLLQQMYLGGRRRQHLGGEDLSASEVKMKKHFYSIFGNKNASKKDIDWVKNLIVKTGVKRECEDKSTELLAKAKKAIMQFPGNEEAKEKLIEIADYIVERKY